MTLYILAGVVLFIVGLKLFGKPWWFLEDLAMRPNEVELFREVAPNVAYIAANAPKPLYGRRVTEQYNNCMVVLTNQRLVIGQKGLGSERYIIRVIFEIDGQRGIAPHGEAKPTGGQLFHVGRDDFRADAEMLKIDTPVIDWEIMTPNAARYLQVEPS
ncbi:MAG: hypothetical protein JWM80_5304 [Cyanobacteria bacterium RYN_339]|nr:hypothetical protein [Cyanobacteria bacterium RYN_339]